MITPRDEEFLRRAIRLAMNGRGGAEPNPLVGCVLARGEAIIGEGWHARYGGPHAEPTALADCTTRGHTPAGATAYVTLEPCCHTNKNTPPCAPRLIAENISRVVVGCLDPNIDVNGNGVRMLRGAGIEVDVAPAGSLMASECVQLIAPFFQSLRKRPYVTVKWAQTADRKIAGAGGARLAITGPATNRAVHQLRSRCDAILVGVDTLLNDDPLLSARDVQPSRLKTRVILDSGLRTPTESRLVQSANREHPVKIFFDRSRIDDLPLAGRRHALEKTVGVTTVSTASEADGRLNLNNVLNVLGDDRVTHLLIEAGPTIARSLFAANVVDRLWVFESPRVVNDETAPSAAIVPAAFTLSGSTKVGDNTLTEFLNRDSESFAAGMPSADFVLTAASSSSASAV